MQSKDTDLTLNEELEHKLKSFAHLKSLDPYSTDFNMRQELNLSDLDKDLLNQDSALALEGSYVSVEDAASPKLPSPINKKQAMPFISS